MGMKLRVIVDLEIERLNETKKNPKEEAMQHDVDALAAIKQTNTRY